MAFFHSSTTATTAAATYAFFKTIVNKPPRRSVYVELQSTCGYRRVTAGGHAEEELIARESGIVRKHSSAGNLLRTCGKADALSIRAIWFTSWALDGVQVGAEDVPYVD